jgi:nitrogen fixation/metabolism regulation signal transduction histidine kinase
MNPETENTLAFFGKMTANLTHEFKNIMAIIQESAGLMEDIMAITPLSKEKYQERFNNSMVTIKNQLQRGMLLASRFNRFAHAPDHSVAEIDLGETIDHFCILTERFARLKHISLESGSHEKQVSLKTNPVFLYMALFYGLESCLSVLAENSAITVSACEKNNKPAVEILCKTADGAAGKNFSTSLGSCPAWEELKDTAEKLNAEIICDNSHADFWLVFN